jgi:hypothetical protein
MNLHNLPLFGFSRFSRHIAIGLVAATVTIAGGAWAQPSGNPKGTVAPSAEGNAARSPAGGRPAGAAGETSSGPLTSESGPANARMRRTEPPGGGTAGGLTHRNLPANDAASKSTTDKGSAGQRPVPPSAASSAPAR